MAHFAELDETNTVLRTIVISNADITDEHGVEHESLGINLCQTLYGSNTTWVQTSYNKNFRKMYAEQGFKYSPEVNVFYNPVGPFPSWSLDANFDWVAPTPHPEDGKPYVWDEPSLSWKEIELPTE